LNPDSGSFTPLAAGAGQWRDMPQVDGEIIQLPTATERSVYASLPAHILHLCLSLEPTHASVCWVFCISSKRSILPSPRYDRFAAGLANQAAMALQASLVAREKWAQDHLRLVHQ
jgi:hypothetical protein